LKAVKKVSKACDILMSHALLYHGKASATNRSKAMNTVQRPLRLSDLRRRTFYIDVSRTEPFVVQSNRRRELSLASLSLNELERLTALATGQLRRGMVEHDESIDEHRATLFFVNRWMDAVRRGTRNGQETTRTADRIAASRQHGRAGSPATGQAA
jgi:hypothetical protein